MNFFFGIKNKYFKTRLTIPKFQNKENIKEEVSIFQTFIEKGKWNIENFYNFEENENFFVIDQQYLDNHKFYFLAKDEDVKKWKEENCLELKKFNNVTNTNPSYRSNLRISNDAGGFSSYQSDYPFSMTEKKGGILSSTNILTNEFADKNIILLKNIYKHPIKEEFNLYIINLKKREILSKEKIYTNKLNVINLEQNFIKKDIYIFTDKYLCIPLYVSLNNNHISFEHTHPPHEYILSNDKFKRVAEIKKKFYEIIN